MQESEYASYALFNLYKYVPQNKADKGKRSECR